MDDKKRGLGLLTLAVFIMSTLYFAKAMPSFAVCGIIPNEKELGEMCIKQVTLIAKNDEVKPDEEREPPQKKESEIKAEKKIKLTSEPLVIIYHTHSSESYMPYKESNYHREEVKGTVREVGDVLEAELEEKGINVIHDNTVHDRPSYNESYSKSLATIQSLVSKYPTAVYIIDLHRDAAASTATEGKYTIIDGKRVAKFSMVVGQANENYVELYDFAKEVGARAEEMYDGFGGAIIEQNYKYNEFISNNALLLEVGNNKNTIEEAKECGRYFADVLASIIEEKQ